MNTGRRSRRRRPTIEAVIAARISTPSSPSRKTMIAELVTTVALLAESPSVAAASAELGVQREPRLADRAPRRAVGDLLGEAVLAARAEPDQALDVEREALVEGAQPALRAELEERVGLQARLLGLAVLAGAGGGLHAVQRERDQVVVGLVGLLGPRPAASRPSSALSACGGDLLDLLVRRRRPPSAWPRSRRARPSSVERARRRSRCARGRAWRAGRAGRRTRRRRRCGTRRPR